MIRASAFERDIDFSSTSFNVSDNSVSSPAIPGADSLKRMLNLSMIL